MVKLDMRLPMALAYGVPDSDTPGWIGLLVMDVTDTRKRVYRCVAADGAAYTWEPFAAEGSGTGTGGGIDVETDPTVPAWAKEPKKPTYTADEIGALPSSTKIPSKTSDLTNDSGFVADSQVYVKDETYSQTEVDGLIDALSKRLEAVADSDDVALDQLSEIVAYIKANKSLIDSITTSKVSISDIVDNLTTGDSKKPLSAAQGKALKALYDAIPAWAKESSKPSYSKSDVGLGNVDNVKQYSASNPPPYPVKSVNGKTGAVTLGAADVGAATAAQFSQLSKAIDNVRNEIPDVPVQSVNGKTGAVKLSADDVGATTKEYVDEEIADLKTQGMQQTPLYPEGETVSECLAWLKDNGDTAKVYLLPDGFLYRYMETVVESGPAYTNVLPLAINADGTPYVGTNGEKGYKTGYRLNSSRVEKEATGRCCTGFIPVKYTDVIRFKNIKSPTDGNINGYIHFYGSNFSDNTGILYELADTWNKEIIPSQITQYNSSNSNATNKTAYMRISAGAIDSTSIITINEEIAEGGGTSVVTTWANTGHAFIPADYGEDVASLKRIVASNTADIESLKSGSIGGSATIKDWDAPIYDANIPVFELSAEKAAMTNAANTPANIYAMYDALMAKHPKYITKTDLGLCSDGVNHVYRYDFREPDPHYESGKEWSEMKAKAILMTGVHFEWAGIYSLYYALEEIADNSALRNLRRNTHLIVVPVANPYATIASNYQSGLATPNSYGVRNANGVEIHRNFEVDWVLTEAGSTHYGGAEPLSEVETKYIDGIMAENTDAALFLSAHNCGVDTFWGTGFIWSSTATKYMCNMGFRLVDKLSDAWMDKYGDVLSAGIEEYKTDLLEDGDTRLGWAGLSTSPGTEAKQATKYGIQGTNIETCNPFQIHGTKANPEPSMSAFTMSRGAEVYVNFLLTAFGVYDAKDKKEYRAAEV